MEILKRSILGCLVLFMFVHTCRAQTDTTLRTAFRQSYFYEAQYQYGKAIECMAKVYDASSYEINLRMGWLYYQGLKFTESLSYYRKATALLPMSIEAKLGMAYPLSALERWDDVVAQYKSILAIDAYHAIANYRMALIHYNRSDNANAWKYIEKCINLYPFDFDYMSLAGWIKWREGKKEEAAVLLQKALLIHPDDPTIKSILKK